PEHLHGLLEEVTYQTKKYVGITANEALLELVTRPLGRFLEDTRKLTLRRMKRGRIVDGHGAFVPEHVYLRGTDLRAIGPLDGQAKFRVLDAAHDVG
ncbi:MAG: hypothetical protein GWO16_00730, partial [Gammaproteobacteria bacterium]|nr:hypothetical protein [Gammaproteobacteria bacterium]NIR96642.1 hypothetical protein [Gammaproteobacteria bacterium]NIT62370.1 hypothetical protein [Gammaproteobacteria bacterium]NIV19304.1 hypothetical protein [Gammaproteobacteria bacterium]NIX10219.1 hypothetical protein [Gammaproteobacteria bacterium]